MSDSADRAARFLVWQGPAVLYALVIFFMSSLPGSEIPDMPFRFGDKLVHSLEFGLFGMFLYRAFRFTRPHGRHPTNPFRMTLAFGFMYAALDEFHQLFVPGRFCSAGDFLFDCIGLALIAAVSAKIHAARGPRILQSKIRGACTPHSGKTLNTIRHPDLCNAQVGDPSNSITSSGDKNPTQKQKSGDGNQKSGER